MSSQLRGSPGAGLPGGRLISLAWHRLTGELQLLDKLAVQVAPDRRHEAATGRVQSAEAQLLRKIGQSRALGLTHGEVHRLGGFGHCVRLACRKPGGMGLALLVPAQNNQLRGGAICRFRHDCPPGKPKGASGPLCG